MHFTGSPHIKPSQLLNPYMRPPSKPWAVVCLNPYRQAWFRAFDTTPWAGWRPSQQGFEVATAEELVGLSRQLQGRGVGEPAAGEDCCVEAAEAAQE